MQTPGQEMAPRLSNQMQSPGGQKSNDFCEARSFGASVCPYSAMQPTPSGEAKTRSPFVRCGYEGEGGSVVTCWSFRGMLGVERRCAGLRGTTRLLPTVGLPLAGPTTAGGDVQDAPRKICVAGRRPGAVEPVSGTVGSAMYAR